MQIRMFEILPFLPSMTDSGIFYVLYKIFNFILKVSQILGPKPSSVCSIFKIQ